MGEPISIFDDVDEEAEKRATAEAEAEIAAGKGVPHKIVREWLQKLAKGEDVPPPWKYLVALSPSRHRANSALHRQF